jgi:hypothetical protein
VVVDSGKFDWAQNDRFGGLTAPEPAYHGIRFYETFGDMAMVMHMKAVGLRDLGPALSPMNAFLILTGMETLALRMQRHCENALAVAEFLERHPQVSWVSYAGLKSSRYHALACKYLGGRGGSLFTFGVKGGYEAGIKVVEGCELLSHLANIGDTRSLILHPASTTHRQLTEHQRVAAGAGPGVVRLSIGLETVDDIISDLDQALRAAAGQAAPEARLLHRAEDVFQAVAQLDGLERLHQVVIDAFRLGLLHLVAARPSRRHDDRHLLQHGVAAHGLDQVESRHVRHDPVGNDEVEFLLVELLQRFGCAGRQGDLMNAELAQARGDEVPHHLLVIDNEHVEASHRRLHGALL